MALDAQSPRADSNRAVLFGWLLELFVAGNLGFLALDVYLAHSINSFADKLEWLPVFFSAVAPTLLLPALRTRRAHRAGVARLLGVGVGIAAVAVGVGGLVLHLRNTFFVHHTLHNLVYTSPFAAPLSYAGLGLLLLLNRMESDGSATWGAWVVLLALGGCFGNFTLALADHAQNGFFFPSEWVPVFAAALGFGFLLVAALAREPRRSYLRLCIGWMAIEAAVGVLGFALHVRANLEAGSGSLPSRFIYGAPAFAPLLFADIALLAVLGLWRLHDFARR